MRKPQMLILAAACSAALAGCGSDNWFNKRSSSEPAAKVAKADKTTTSPSTAGAAADSRSGTAVNSGNVGSSTAAAPTSNTTLANSSPAAPALSPSGDSTTGAAGMAGNGSTTSASSGMSHGSMASNGASTGGSTTATATANGSGTAAVTDKPTTATSGSSSIGKSAGSDKVTGNGSSAMGTNGSTPASTAKADRTDKADKMATASTGAVAATDKQFFANAAQTDMLEIEASKLAVDRATNEQVKSFASMIVSDHTGTSGELKSMASAKGVTLPTELSGKHKATLEKLQKAQGAEFDRLYAQQIAVQAHRDAVTLYTNTAKNAKDPEVKGFAQKTLPALKQHLTQAQQIKTGTPAAKKPQ